MDVFFFFYNGLLEEGQSKEKTSTRFCFSGVQAVGLTKGACRDDLSRFLKPGEATTCLPVPSLGVV